MSSPSLRAPVLAIAAVVIVAVLGAVVLLLTWPEDPAERAADSTGSSAVEVDGAADSGAADTATAVLRAWSRPGLAYAWWWDGLRPLLSPGARAAYAHTDPEQLPALGEPVVVEEREAATTATVWFRTEAGRFGVDLARSGASEEWQARRILFPGQESMFG